MKNNEKLRNFEAKQQLIAKRKAQGPRDNKIAILAGAGALLLALIGQAAYFGFGPGYVSAEESVAEESAAPEVTSEPNTSEVPDPALAENRIWNASLNLNTEAVSFELDDRWNFNNIKSAHIGDHKFVNFSFYTIIFDEYFDPFFISVTSFLQPFQLFN